MNILLGIIFTLIILNIIVLVHEFGHFITAKKFGVYIEEFSLGMGPVILQRQNHKIYFFNKAHENVFVNKYKFSIRLIPFGGYVKLKGEDEGNESDCFCNLKRWKKLIVLLAGIFMNIVLGVICITLINIAFVDYDDTTIISNFKEYTLKDGTHTEILSDKDGLMKNDEIISINGNRVINITDIQYELSLANDDNADLIIERNGEQVLLQNVHFPTTETQGMKVMSPDFQILVNNKTFGGAMKYICRNTISAINTVWKSLAGLISGKIPAKAMSGIVGVTDTISTTVATTTNFSDLLYYFLYLTFLLSLNIGIFNLLPIPALDGGQSAFCLIEIVIRKDLNKKFKSIINTVFYVMLLCFMAIITVKDIIFIFIK